MMPFQKGGINIQLRKFIFEAYILAFSSHLFHFPAFESVIDCHYTAVSIKLVCSREVLPY
jgi:hypothetical protein